MDSIVWGRMFIGDVGSDLNQITHLYHYPDLNQRDRVRKSVSVEHAWQTDYIDVSRPMLSHQVIARHLPPLQ